MECGMQRNPADHDGTFHGAGLDRKLPGHLFVSLGRLCPRLHIRLDARYIRLQGTLSPVQIRDLHTSIDLFLSDHYLPAVAVVRGCRLRNVWSPFPGVSLSHGFGVAPLGTETPAIPQYHGLSVHCRG